MTVRYADANRIHPRERDGQLFGTQWPSLPRSGRGWALKPTAPNSEQEMVYRHIAAPDPRLGPDIEETIVRFPSAPIYSIHREFDYQLQLRQLNYHSIRFLRPVGGDARSIERIFLICNGLNEVDRMGFYYRLASLLFAVEPDSAVLIHPVPGHLTRFPLPGAYCERPLDRYLADSGNLFRQFLRYAVESLWLLSILVPHCSYRSATGLDLLAEGDEEQPGRADPAVVARAIFDEWQALFGANEEERRGEEISEESVPESVALLRTLCGWTAAEGVDPPQDKRLRPPALHVVGYSLGGFLAQSLFFTWPFAISSCTTICSGGALRNVAPTAFAHPEDWTNVLYLLRYEIENAMLCGGITAKGDTVAGVRMQVFGYLLHIFYEVFLQDFRGEYASRVSEYVERLLFVVGGNDPIVRVERVQEASPPGGINLLEIASLGHFIGREKGEWQSFWLPRVAETLAAFSKRAESIHARSIYENWWGHGLKTPPPPKGGA